MSLTNATIQDVIENGGTITVYCHKYLCNHSAELDLIKLRDKLGPTHGSMHDDLAWKMRCSKCGGKKVGLIYSPGGNKHRVPGSNLYRVPTGGR